jgi:glycosyl transferase family 25
MNYFNLILSFILILLLILRYTLPKFESFNNRNDIKIYFINLNQNKDRLKYIKEQCNKENINIIRFPAYYGKDLNEYELINQGILSRKHNLRKGQLGCAISHYKLMENIKKNNEDIALILEDDIIIPDNFKKKLNDVLNNLPDKWDIVFLGGCNIKGKMYKDKYIIPTEYGGTYNLCMHSYLVNKKSLNKLLKCFQPFYRPIDSQLRDKYKDLNVYFLYPNLILQNKEIRSTRRDIDGLQQSKYWKENQGNINII